MTILREQIDASRLLVEAGLGLFRATESTQALRFAADTGRALCGAETGVLLYRPSDTGSVWSAEPGASVTPLAATFPIPDTVIRIDNISTRFGTPALPEQISRRALRSLLAVPLPISAGAGAGAFLYISGRTAAFSREDELSVSVLASQTAASLETIRLRKQLSLHADKQKEHARRQSELAAIVTSSDDPILSKDLNGIITSWNDAATRVLGYTREEMIGQSILKLIPPELHADEELILSKIRAGERIDHFETTRLTKSGERIPVALTVSPVKDETGRIVGASKILHDISNRKRMEESLLQAEKIAATGRMAATIAHEINNPLEAVVNLLYLMRPMVIDPQGMTYLETAENELTRVSHIAKQTLGYYREHSSAKPTSISGLVEQALKVYEPRCRAYRIALERHVESDRKIVLRQGEMLQVISNLITNSLYAMPQGGTLTVSVEDVSSPSEGLLLRVQDTGVGISKENLDRIFEAFFTTRRTIGTGIGLFVAKQFVEGHGGSIRVESSTAPENHGTTLEIFLPVHTSHELQSD
ncbi:two-component system sensor histidine kinase NtrB [Terriglobus albidus]|uniref:two-component system sensor histidine kinase NtrB n=1 Tax=Terriglobus albidus TaxID=1592106 RepID=UPI0021DFFB01|nr:PAS domain S-box protein [Terriglobus albidus]